MDEPGAPRVDYLRLLRRLAGYWRLILVMFFAVAIPMTAWALLFIPETHEASASIFLEDPKSGERGLLRDWVPTNDASFQQALLRSRSLAEAVTQQLPRESLDELLARSLQRSYFPPVLGVVWRLVPRESLEAVLRWVLWPEHFERLQTLIRPVPGSSPAIQTDLQRAVTELQTARMDFRIRASGEVEIRAIAHSPRVAMDLANTYVEVLRSRSRSYVREEARAAREFIETFLNQTKATLQGAEESLARLQRASGTLRLPQRSAVELAQLAQLENELADIQVSKEIARTRLNFLKGGKGRAGKPAPGMVSLAAQQHRERLTKLQEKLAALQERYTDQHPLVVSTQAEIRSVQASLAAHLQPAQDPQPPVQATLTPADRAALAKQMADLEVEVSSLEARESSLKQRIARLSRSVSNLSAEEMEASKLLRKVESHRNLYAVLSERLGTARVQEQGAATGLRVIDLAALPSAPRRSPAAKLVLLGLLLGLALGVGTAVVIEHFNQPVETEEDVVHVTGLPVLGWLPKVGNGRPKNRADRKPLSFVEDPLPWSLPVEGCRTIRTALESLRRQRQLRTIMLASPGPSDGKSTILLNLGWVYWELGYRLIMVDADLRRPSLHRALPAPAQSGLAELLAGSVPPEQVEQPIRDEFRLVPAGSREMLSGGLLSTERVRRLLDLLKDRADLVLFDSAPVLAVSDNLILASMVDGVILVVRAGHTQRRDLSRARELLERVNASLLGVVINQVSPRETRRYYSRYAEYYTPAGSREP